MLTVKELREAIKSLPDDMPVIVPGYEGGYDSATLYEPMEFRRISEGGGYFGAFDCVNGGWWRDEEDWIGPPFMALLLGRDS